MKNDKPVCPLMSYRSKDLLLIECLKANCHFWIEYTTSTDKEPEGCCCIKRVGYLFQFLLPKRKLE